MVGFKEKMDKNKTLNIIFILIYLSVFFFKIIPIPVRRINPADGWGWYFTSLIYQISVKNILGFFVFTLCFFGIWFLINYLRGKIKNPR